MSSPNQKKKLLHFYFCIILLELKKKNVRGFAINFWFLFFAFFLTLDKKLKIL